MCPFSILGECGWGWGSLVGFQGGGDWGPS